MIFHIENAEQHIRTVFFGWPITVVSADDQLKAMTPPDVLDMITDELKKAAARNEMSDLRML